MKYAHLDNNNKILGWYDPELHNNIPTPNVEVTDEEWLAALEISANTYDVQKGLIYIESNSVTTIEPSRIEVLKQQLAQTDYKDLPSYDKRNTPEWIELMAQRQAWREEIRSLELQ